MQHIDGAIGSPFSAPCGSGIDGDTGGCAAIGPDGGTAEAPGRQTNRVRARSHSLAPAREGALDMEDRTKVLVVDDDRRMVRTTCDILNVKGFEAVAAYSGEEALEKIRAGTFDCVLMDIKMPGIDGIESLKAMRGIAPRLPIILMSAYVTDEQAREARAEGAYTVLAKPVNIQLVLSFLSILRKEESILVVDDDANFCETLRNVLEARGYRVETEMDPDKVLAHLDDSYKLVVILDLKICAMNGSDVLGAIRRKYPTKPVVLVTSHKDDAVDPIAMGLRIGAYACVYKPLETGALLATINEIRLKKIQNLLGEPGAR